MGNFYTNITLGGVAAEEVAAALEERQRTALVAPHHPGGVTVFDRGCEAQDPGVLGGLAQALSASLRCPALAVLNHDDDILALVLYRAGSLEAEYETGHTADLRVAPLCTAWGRPWVTLPVWLLLHGPRPLFEVARHFLLARLLGLPSWSVGTGYKYLQQGEYPEGLSPANVRQIPARG